MKPDQAPRLSVQIYERYPLSPSCHVRAVTFGQPEGLPMLLPLGWTPVMNAVGTEVTLQPVHGICPECGLIAKIELDRKVKV